MSPEDVDVSLENMMQQIGRGSRGRFIKVRLFYPFGLFEAAVIVLLVCGVVWLLPA